MRKVFKYPLQITPEKQIINLPQGSTIVSVGKQNDQLMIWVEVDETRDTFPIEFYVFGTGQEVPADLEHKGTVMIDPYVWHIYVKWIYKFTA